MDYKKAFPLRLSLLRERKDISARHMSQLLGQNPGYINSIERGNAYPTMVNFFMICDFLEITPMDFFCFDEKKPAEMNRLNRYLSRLNERQFSEIYGIVEDLYRLNKRQK